MKALQPEIVEEVKPEREDRKRTPSNSGGDKRKSKGKKQEEDFQMEVEAPTEPQYTAMQMAWQAALERSKGRGKVRPKSYKSATEEQEKLFNRTLEKRISSN
jgi:hypothetical protein